MGKSKTITIPDKLYGRLKQLADNSGFEGVEEFVSFVFEEMVINEDKGDNKMTEDEKREIDKGLEDLGYKEKNR